MTSSKIASAVSVLATAAIPASELVLSPEQIEAIGSWRLHIVLGAVAVISMLLAARMFRFSLGRIESITIRQASSLGELTTALHAVALANQRLSDRLHEKPCLLADSTRRDPSPPVRRALSNQKETPHEK